MFSFWCEASSTLCKRSTLTVCDISSVGVSAMGTCMYNTFVLHHFNRTLKPLLLVRSLSGTTNTGTSITINSKNAICGLGSPRFELLIQAIVGKGQPEHIGLLSRCTNRILGLYEQYTQRQIAGEAHARTDVARSPNYVQSQSLPRASSSGVSHTSCIRSTQPTLHKQAFMAPIVH